MALTATQLKTILRKQLIIPVDRPFLCLLMVSILTTLLFAQVQQLTFDTSVESFLDNSNPQHQIYIDFKKTYGLSEYIVVFIESNNVFTSEFLQNWRELQSELEKTTPHLAKIESLLNTRWVSVEDDSLVIDALITDNTSETDLQEIKKIATTTPYYLNRLINADGNVTSMIIQLQANIKDNDTSHFRHIVINDVEQSLQQIYLTVAASQSKFNGKLRVGGSPTATVELLHTVKRDTIVLMLFALLVISFFLLLFFHRLAAVFLPLLVLCLSVSLTMSLMVAFHFPIQVTGAILPSFLVVVCVGDSVHLLHTFYHHIDDGIDKKQALIDAINETFVPMFYTTLTTSIGLISFTNSDVLPIQSFGLFSALGVWIALLLTMVCLPALLILFPVRALPKKTKSETLYQCINSKILDYIKYKAKHIVTIAILLAISTAYCVSHLSLSHNPLQWFDKSNSVRQSIELLDTRLMGTHPVELLIDTGRDGGVYDPIFLDSLDNWVALLQAQAIKGIHIKSTTSILDLIKEVHAILSEERTYALPKTQELIAQELLLLQVNAADEVAAYSNSSFRTLRLTISTPWQDAVNYTAFLDELQRSFSQHITTSNASVPHLEITGMAAIGNRTITEMLVSMVNSYLIAGILISAVFVILLKSVKLGLLMMLPNLLPILLVLSIMYFTHVPFDMFTLMIGSIALGLIVDDSVHFIYGFQRTYKKTGRVFYSIEVTLKSVGSALFVTTVVLCSGFLVYTFSSLNNMQTFGLLTSLCILLALIADFLVAPAIILLSYKDAIINNKNNIDVNQTDLE